MIKAPRNKVIISPIFDSDTSPGGIIIPDMAKERCDQGIVKYIGDNVVDISIGDYVVFGGYNGTSVAIEGEGHLIIMHKDFIHFTIEPDNTKIPGIYFLANSKRALLNVTTAKLEKELSPNHVAYTLELINEIFFNSLITSDYETTIDFIAKAYQENPWRKGMTIKNKIDSRPKQSEFDGRL